MSDRRTDERTDRILIARPRLHFMQRGRNQQPIDRDAQLEGTQIGAGKCLGELLVAGIFRGKLSE